MVEKATEVLHAHRDDEFEPQVAETILDAILPQVTTVAELARVPHGSILLGSNGEYRPVPLVFTEVANPADWIGWYAPLTVVWQP